MSKPLASAQVIQAFRPGELQAINPSGSIGVQPGIVIPQAEPAEASTRPGLNECTVSVERLADDAALDFGWEPVSGVAVTKPPPPPASPVPLDPRITAATSKRIKRNTTTPSAAATGAKLSAADLLAETAATQALLQLTPLWEGDVNLPTASDSRPRRLVVREHELYFKATPGAQEFIPLARRLVYVDIVNLPAVVA